MQKFSFLERFFGRSKESSTAQIAKDRLTMVLIAERRAGRGSDPEESERLRLMQEEILAVVSKYYPVDQESVSVHVERKENVEMLEVSVMLNS